MKIIFLDADGTLFSSDGTIPSSALQAVRKAQSNGHKICLCTGRQRMEIYGDLEKIHYDAMITGSGGDVYIDDKLIAEHAFTSEQMHILVPYLLLHDIPSLYESREYLYCGHLTQNKLVALTKKKCSHLSNEEYQKHGLVQMLRNSRYAPDFYSFPINKITFMSSKTPFHTIRKDLKNQFEVVPNTFAPLGKGSGEISSLDFDKGTGMNDVLNYYHGNKEDAIAIGDGFNDICMFENAAISVAMKNADPEVQKKADFVTDSMMDDGIYKAFMKLNLL